MVALGLEADMHELGSNTCMAANGRQAFRYAMTQRPDVALTLGDEIRNHPPRSLHAAVVQGQPRLS